MNKYSHYLNEDFNGQTNESITAVFQFMKGRNNIKKYFKELSKNAKNFINKNKQLDGNTDGNVSKQRETLRKEYEDNNKVLEGIKKKIDDIKKDNVMLQKLWKIEQLRYQISIGRLGEKNGIALAKLKGVGSDFDKIKDSDISELEGDLKDDAEKAKDSADSEVSKLSGEFNELIKGSKEDLKSKESEIVSMLTKIKSVDTEKAKKLQDTYNDKIKDNESPKEVAEKPKEKTKKTKKDSVEDNTNK